MKKLLTMMLGLSFVLGTAQVFAGEKDPPKKEIKKKNIKKKGDVNMKKTMESKKGH